MVNQSVLTSARAALRALEASGNQTGEYLETRGWFMRSLERHQRVLYICQAGYGAHIDGLSGDFNDELTRVEGLFQ